VANQLQLSVTHAPLIAQGVAANMAGLDQSVTLDGGGLIDYCRIHDITVQAWAPFQSGFFTGVFFGDAAYPELNAVLDRLAVRYAEWRTAGGDAEISGLRSAYTENCVTIGKRVRAILPGGAEISGLATTVDIDGRLVVVGRPVAAGDVVHLRPIARVDGAD
jgi:hypothetical protein